MKFLTLADLTGMVETELFAQTYKSYALATVRYPVLKVTATVEPFENGRGSRDEERAVDARICNANETPFIGCVNHLTLSLEFQSASEGALPFPTRRAHTK